MSCDGKPTLNSDTQREVIAGGNEKDFQNLKTKLEETEKLFEERITSLKNSHRSKLQVFMATTTFSAFVAGVCGVFLGTFLTNRFQTENIDQILPPSSQCSRSSCQQGPDVNHSLSKMEKTLNQCLVQQKKDNEVINGLNSSVAHLEQDLKKKYEDVISNATLREFIMEAQISEMKEVFVSKDWLFLILLMGLFEVAVVGIVWVMWQKLAETLRQKIRQHSTGSAETNGVGYTGNRASTAESLGIQGDGRILNQVRKALLQKRICVVAFHSETVDKHTKIVKDLLSQNSSVGHVTVCQFLVSSHDDILQLPPSKLYMVFVDFNERNVILEDPQKGLGNLRLTTVQAINLMEAEVVLIYSRDNGSLSLTSGDLYNTDLTSVKQHSELKRLERSRRMLSVFENFNKCQSDHIVKVVKKTCM